MATSQIIRECLVCGSDYVAFSYYLRKGKGLHCSHKCAAVTRAAKFPRTFATCRTCGRSFRSAPCRKLNGRSVYCSRDCAIKGRSPRVEICQNCGLPFNNHNLKFCSAVCWRSKNRGALHVRWTGGLSEAICESCGKSFRYRSTSTRGRFCSMRCMARARGRISGNSRTFSRARGGARADLGGLYFRSAWEANYARYLNFLVRCKEIREWCYEPDTFEFAVKRGTRFYTPDFKVVNKDGSTEYHEVKGWMDQKSKTKLDRMAKYYPDVKILLVSHKEMREIRRATGALIPQWERSPKHTY